jgi:hypothetical protein
MSSRAGAEIVMVAVGIIAFGLLLQGPSGQRPY